MCIYIFIYLYVYIYISRGHLLTHTLSAPELGMTREVGLTRGNLLTLIYIYLYIYVCKYIPIFLYRTWRESHSVGV